MIGKILQLSIKEINYLIIAFILLSIAKLSIKILPFSVLQNKFQAITKVNFTKEISDQDIKAKALAINRIAFVFNFLGFSCLPKSLAFKYWLRNTKEIAVHFGVQKDNKNNLIAHAWVSKSNSIILGDDPNIGYKPIWEW
jgi:Transglutaminase-like superfamily